MKHFLNTGKSFIHTRTLAAVILVLLICLFAGLGIARPLTETQTIVCFGSSRIYNEVTNAKSAAVSQALSNTVSTAASRIIPAADIARHFELIAAVINNQRDSFIPDYRIVREYHTEKFFHVLVEATVSAKKIKDALADAGLEIMPENLPSVLFMIAEKNIDDLGFNYWWKQGYGGFSDEIAEAVIRQAFSKAGFTLISPDLERALQDDEVLAMDLDAEPADYQAVIMAKQLGADLVVVGQARARAMSNRMGSNIRTFRADVQMHVLNAKTGEKLTTISEHALNVSEDAERGSKNSMADAAHKAATSLADRIISLWRDASAVEGKFIITVQGDRILPHLERLRSLIEGQPGVSGLGTTEMTSSKATLAVDYQGTAQELANKLLIQSFDGFGINIVDLSTETMDIELIAR